MSTYCITTQNPYFDRKMNEVDQEYDNNHIIFKKNITIPKQSLINLKGNTDEVFSFIEKMLYLVQYCHLQNVELKLTEEDTWCLVVFIIPYTNRQRIEEYLRIAFALHLYKIYFDESHKVFRMARILDYFQK